MEKRNGKQSLNGDKKSKRTKKIIASVVIIILAISSPFLVYWILQMTLNTSSPMTVVISGSMEPTYHKGDLLFLYGEDPANIEVNDVIVFQSKYSSEPVVHRVIDKRYNGEYQFITKGDANTFNDSSFLYDGWLSEDKIIGKVVGWVPFIGWVKIILTEGSLLLPLIFLIIIVLIISVMWDFVKKEENNENQKEKERYRNPSSFS